MNQRPHIDPGLAHLLRRAGFGLAFGDVGDAGDWQALGLEAAIDRLVNFEEIPDDVDEKIGLPGYLSVVNADTFNEEGILVKSTAFDPNGNLVDAMQRWLFRMMHSRRPLQEKMTLFWHHHFATGRSKIVEQLSYPGAIRAFATKAPEDADGATGQIELLRNNALGNFRDLLRAISRDVAMVCWLDGDSNRKGKPQENFARELMELFTIGHDQFTEADVYAGARVFTGWNLLPVDADAKDVHYRGFHYYPEEHDTDGKTFSFAIYPDGGKTVPPRSAAQGIQDGFDLIDALVAHPATGEFLARKLYAFFVEEDGEPDARLIGQMAGRYYSSGYEIREVLRTLLRSPQFQSPDSHWARYSWPAEYVIRLLKEIGWEGVTAYLPAMSMISMGQAFFDPPDVSGWKAGREWFSTSTMLARMNYATSLCAARQDHLANEAKPYAGTPESLVSYCLSTLTCKPMTAEVRETLVSYLRNGQPWTGSEAQVRSKIAGLAHLVGASNEYQLI